MKHKSAFVATLLYLTAIHSLNVYAASDTAGDTKNDANAPQDQPKKKVEPHSHLEEKMGVVSKKPEETKEVETARACHQLSQMTEAAR